MATFTTPICCYSLLLVKPKKSKSLLHFCILFVNSNLNVVVEPEYFCGRILSMRKYCQLFTHESNTFLLKICHSNHWKRQPPKTPSSPWGTWTPSNTPIPRPTPLTTPNSMWIQSAVFPQYITFRKDKHTDRPTRQMLRQKFYFNTAYALLKL